MSRSGAFLFACCISSSILSFLFSATGIAQPSKKDADTAAINRLIAKGKATSDADSAIAIFNTAAAACDAVNDYDAAAVAYIEASGRYFDKGDLEHSEDYKQKALAYAEKSNNKGRIVNCLVGMGNICSMRGKFVEATQAYFRALELLKTNPNPDAEISIYSNLAALSQQSGDDSKILYYLDLAQQRATVTKLPNERSDILLANILVNKGSYFTNNNKPDSAIQCYLRALDISKKLSASQKATQARIEAYSLTNISALFLETKEYVKAETFARKAILLAHDKYPAVEANASFTLGQALTGMKRFKEAEPVLLSAIRQDHAMNMRDELVHGYYALAELYKGTGEYKKATLFLDSFIAIKDTIKSIENLTAINKIEAKYELVKKDEQIVNNELQIARQKNKITRKNIWLGSILTFVVLSVAFSFSFYRNNQRKQAATIKTLKQENTISILKGVIQGEENERIRMARELHDGIGSMFSALKLCFAAVQQENKDILHSQKYVDTADLLQKTADEVRRVSHNLMPEVLLHHSLTDAVKSHCIHLQHGTNMHIDLETCGDLEQLNDELKLNIYRIVQELLKNVVEHAHATRVIVQMIQNANNITLTVEDNGIGFDNNNANEGMGLHSLKTRMISYDGQLIVRSEKGSGTTVIVEFPVAAKRK